MWVCTRSRPASSLRRTDYRAGVQAHGVHRAILRAVREHASQSSTGGASERRAAASILLSFPDRLVWHRRSRCRLEWGWHSELGLTPKPTCPPGQGGSRKRMWLLGQRSGKRQPSYEWRVFLCRTDWPTETGQGGFFPNCHPWCFTKTAKEEMTMPTKYGALAPTDVQSCGSQSALDGREATAQ